MADISVVPQPATQEEEVSPRAELAGVLVMSFVSLLLELALTRLFSVILFYHFAFLAISIALLGLGAGGSFRAPMAIAVIGGLVTSTLLTLLIVPAAYSILDIVMTRLGQLRVDKEPKPEPEPVSVAVGK